jgi:hypothetical protein
MPAPMTTTMLVLGAVLTSVSPVAGAAVAGVGALFEFVSSWIASAE